MISVAADHAGTSHLVPGADVAREAGPLPPQADPGNSNSEVLTIALGLQSAVEDGPAPLPVLVPAVRTPRSSLRSLGSRPSEDLKQGQVLYVHSAVAAKGQKSSFDPFSAEYRFLGVNRWD